MPFGMGPRNCIGMRFAQVTMKLAIVEILQRFDVGVCEETQVRSRRDFCLSWVNTHKFTSLFLSRQVPLELGFSGLLAPKKPIKLKLTPRSTSLSNNNSSS